MTDSLADNLTIPSALFAPPADPLLAIGAQADGRPVGETRSSSALPVETLKDYAVFMLDPHGNVISWNVGAQRIKGYQASEIIGQHFSRFYTAEDLLQGKPEAELRIALEEGKYEEEGWRVRKDGSRFRACVLVTALFDEKSRLQGFAKVTRDMTSMSRAQAVEQALRESEARTRAILAAAVDAIITIDERGSIDSVNPAGESLFGYSADELIGRNVNMLMPEPYHGEHDGYLANYRSTGHKKIIGIGREVVGRRKDGTTFPMHLAVSELRLGSRHMFTGIARNITDLKNAQRQLEESVVRTRAILETAVDAIITIDEHGGVESLNPAAVRLFGYTADELLGRNVNTLMPEPYHGEHDGYLANYRATGIKKIIGSGREVIGRRKDGTTFPMELSVSEVLLGDRRLFTGIVRDISERAKAEELQRQNATQLQERNVDLTRSNQELDDFAYIASHDLKEPLRGIHNYSTFLIQDYGDKIDAEGQSKLHTLKRLTQRMETLLDSLLDFSRVGRVNLAIGNTDLSVVLTEVVDSLQITIHEQAIDVRIPRPMPTVQCDRVRIAEVFRNLITNAMKYNDKAEKWIEIGFDCGPAGAGRPVFHVRDNGIGMREKHFESVFRIFKRLHSREKFGGGTGVGLTIVKKIVERHGGHIWIESIVDEGTTFYFTLAEEPS